MVCIVNYSQNNLYLCERFDRIIMERKLLNRIKVVLAEKNKSNKWLAEQLDKDPAMVSKWVTNTNQPNIETLIQIAKVLDVSVNDLLRTE